jgi:apolipoprotein N-acyltransferase
MMSDESGGKISMLKDEPNEAVSCLPSPDSSFITQHSAFSSVPVLFLSLASAALLWASFFPLALGWLAWFALVPLLALVRRPLRKRTVFLASWCAGLFFFWPALQWMRVADYRMYFTWMILATYCSFYFPLAIALLRWLDRRTTLPLTWTTPVVWCALEFFRARFIGGFYTVLIGSHQHDVPGGFGWYFLGYSQHDFLEVIQIADLAGVYGVSFLVGAVNGLLFELLFARSWFRRLVVAPEVEPRFGRLSLLKQGSAVLVGLLAVLAYGNWQLHQGPAEPGPRLALLQSNIDQRIRNMGAAGGDGSEDAIQKMGNQEEALTDLAARFKPDLIVWPETSLPAAWVEEPPGSPIPETQKEVEKWLQRSRAALLMGVSSYVAFPADPAIRPRPPLRIWHYNSAVLIGREGRYLGRYDKIHLVPFGEYVPLRNWFPCFNVLSPYDFDYSVHPGEHFTRFHLAAPGGTGQKWTFGVMICYEDTDPVMARPYGGGDGLAPASFLLNISNDGWFDGTSEHDEHLALCRFRAIECRRAVARAVNMGISAVIDANGRVLAPLPRPAGNPEGLAGWEIPPDASALPVSEWGRFKKVAGVLVASIPIDHRASFYARWGDWLPVGCWGVLGVLGVLRFRRRTGEAK